MNVAFCSVDNDSVTDDADDIVGLGNANEKNLGIYPIGAVEDNRLQPEELMQKVAMFGKVDDAIEFYIVASAEEESSADDELFGSKREHELLEIEISVKGYACKNG